MKHRALVGEPLFDPMIPRQMLVCELALELSKYPAEYKVWATEIEIGKPVLRIVSVGMEEYESLFHKTEKTGIFRLGMEPVLPDHARWCHWTVGSIILSGKEHSNAPAEVRRYSWDEKWHKHTDVDAHWTRISVVSRVDSVMLMVAP